MATQCAGCQAENRDDAKFCDKCGAPLSGGAVDTATANGGEQARMNWGAILIVLVIVVGLGWVLFGPSGKGGGAGQTGDMSNPHAGTDMGGSVADGVANPHGGDSADVAMNEMMDQMADLKAQLDSDPLNTDLLGQLYQTYGMVSMTDRIRPYLDAAVDTLLETHGDLDDEELFNKLNGIAYSTYFGGVPDEGLNKLDLIQQSIPDYKEITLIKANIVYDSEQGGFPVEMFASYGNAETLYTQYMDETTPEEAGLRYWQAKTDRATLYLAQGSADGESAMLNKAIDEFTEVTDDNPLFWNAWFNLGVAQLTVDKEDEAEIAFSRALDVSDNDDERYRTQLELSKLRGEEPPAPPGGGMGGGVANPHGGGMGSPESSTANPHGGTGMGSTDGSMSNPHGGMGMGGGETPPDDGA